VALGSRPRTQVEVDSRGRPIVLPAVPKTQPFVTNVSEFAENVVWPGVIDAVTGCLGTATVVLSQKTLDVTI